MNWNDGDFAEELYVGNDPDPMDIPDWVCAFCGGTEMWFDRTISYYADGTEEGMVDRCAECGRATCDVPEADNTPEDEQFDVENDGG